MVEFVQRIVSERPKFMQNQTDKKSDNESDHRSGNVVDVKKGVQKKKRKQIDRRSSTAGNNVSDEQMFC
jgi:hypothetical protein